MTRKEEEQIQPAEELTNKEVRGIIGGALLAGIMIVFVFIGAMFLFLLFCTHVWFA